MNVSVNINGYYTKIIRLDFLRNGDTAFAACITNDFSPACSQWWRCIESVLRRKLIVLVGQLLDENPEWLQQDEASVELSEKESLFIQVLASPNRRAKLSLCQMLVVLETCMSDCRIVERTSNQIPSSEEKQSNTSRID